MKRLFFRFAAFLATLALINSFAAASEGGLRAAKISDESDSRDLVVYVDHRELFEDWDPIEGRFLDNGDVDIGIPTGLRFLSESHEHRELRMLWSSFKRAWKKAKDAAIKVAKSVSAAVEAGKVVVKQVINSAKKVVENVKETINCAKKASSGGITSNVTGVFGCIKEGASDVISTVKDGIANATNATRPLIQEAREGIVDAWNSTRGIVGDLKQGYVEAREDIRERYDQAKNATMSMYNDAAAKFGIGGGNGRYLLEDYRELSDELLEEYRELYEDSERELQDVLATAGDDADEICGEAENAKNIVVEELEQGFDEKTEEDVKVDKQGLKDAKDTADFVDGELERAAAAYEQADEDEKDAIGRLVEEDKKAEALEAEAVADPTNQEKIQKAARAARKVERLAKRATKILRRSEAKLLKAGKAGEKALKDAAKCSHNMLTEKGKAKYVVVAKGFKKEFGSLKAAKKAQRKVKAKPNMILKSSGRVVIPLKKYYKGPKAMRLDGIKSLTKDARAFFRVEEEDEDLKD